MYVLECIKKLPTSFFLIQFKILSRSSDFRHFQVSEKFTTKETLFRFYFNIK